LVRTASGYLTETTYVPLFQDQTQDFDLEPAEAISLGQVVQAPVGTDRCASLGYGAPPGSLCRRYALPVPASGTLEVAISSSPFDYDVSVLTPEGAIAVYASSSVSPLRVTLQVSAGTYQIDVVHRGSARAFELTTSLR
jgi:hypothetical protein